VTPAHLYTLGYEGLDIETFIAHLQKVGVQTVVDVRELPLSRKKGFSKTALSERLKLAGIAYRHEPAQGCPKNVHNHYRDDMDWARYTRSFLSYLTTQYEPVKALAKLAKVQTACLICFEADYDYCHRTFVARAAIAAGAPMVKHLLAKTDCLDRGSHVKALADRSR
jgi:uncharacterized protein (DUF488 family)